MNGYRLPQRGKLWMISGLAVAGVACGQPESEPAAILLVDRFDEATVENVVETQTELPRIEWAFDEESEDPAWQGLDGLAGLRVRDGRLTGRTTGPALLAIRGPAGIEATDFFHALEIKLKTSAGTRLGVSFESDEELDVKKTIEKFRDSAFFDFNIDLNPGDDLATYTLTGSHARFRASFPISSARHILIRPTDAAGVEFEIESVRLITVREHLATIPSGIGWQGLDEVFRETMVSRSPEKVTFEVEIPSEPFLDLALGTVDSNPVTFTVDATLDGTETRLLRRTVSTPLRWEPAVVDLSDLVGRRVALSFSLESDREGYTRLLGLAGDSQPGRWVDED